ncbi:MAG TPA: substrate-binding domain-containing protein [Chitinophagaceae bacterium]|nr:substrate-binding domain-containing protein [Chitinophagaceae bacterium]
MKSVSIKDIANQVGVSTTTVSFVLNGKAKEKRISEELKNEILKIASKLNYRPNQIARGLRTGQTHTLGLIVEDISNPFFANLAKVVEQEADKFGYTVMFCCTENSETKASSLINMLRHRQMDGFIITPTPGMEDDIRKLADEKRPLVLIDRYFPKLDSSYVTVDNYQGAYEATRYLLGKGHKRIGLITIESSQVQMEKRYEGYIGALKDNGVEPSEDLILRLPFDLEKSEAVSLISDHIRKNKPDSLFFTTNYLGVFGLESLRVSGIRIPGDMGMICFDDNDLFRLGSPSVTVVAQPIELIGREAVASLLHQLKNKGRDEPFAKLILEPHLVQRET